MNSVLGMNIPNELMRLILDRMELVDHPYYFRLKGKSGMGYTRNHSAHIAYHKVKRWANQKGAEVMLIQDRGDAIIFELTDPIARIIEHVIQNRRK